MAGPEASRIAILDLLGVFRPGAPERLFDHLEEDNMNINRYRPSSDVKFMWKKVYNTSSI